MSFNIPRTKQKRVVIVGGGFGGLKLAQNLKATDLQVVLVDKNNYHQFLPLIYQVASAGMEPTSISFPFRKIFHKRNNFYFRLAEVRTIFPDKNTVQTSIGKIEYDYLILAAGTTSNFFGNKHVEEYAIPMKTVSEAMGLRNALLSNFERAVTCSDEHEMHELLNVVIVGGGASGVEIAGAISEMKKFAIPQDYPDMDKNLLHIYLIEAGERLLAGMSPESSRNALDALTKMGVEVKLRSKVVDYRDKTVILESGEEIPTRSFIWVSGVSAVEISNMDPAWLGRGKRILVDEYNRVKGSENIFAIGDQCLMNSDKNFPNGHPQMAQPAIQQGELLAKNLRRKEKGEPMEPFQYNDLGSMATIGRNKAVAEFANMKLHGWFAWLIWLVVHLRSLLGIRNKVLVLLNWLWNYITYDYSMRLIIYARRAKEILEREAREAVSHWGEDMLEQQDEENKEEGK